MTNKPNSSIPNRSFRELVKSLVEDESGADETSSATGRGAVADGTDAKLGSKARTPEPNGGDYDPSFRSGEFHRIYGAFDPETISLLAAALDAAWRELEAEYRGRLSAKKGALIAALTKNLLAAFDSGERDLGELKKSALNGMARHPPKPLGKAHIVARPASRPVQPD
ncbi:hypothetical protein SAMN05519103_09519 [Rhizobiales bacterium GAS113]|nr:hypothetical protein SAMN05519103_09519 [Rhizobiales bacterium GAS113]